MSALKMGRKLSGE